jgi:hypothetical protein
MSTLMSYRKEAILQLRGAALQRLEEAARTIRATALVTLSGGRHGRQYYVPGTRTVYIASAPGEAPASATGRLRQEVHTSVNMATMTAQVGTPLEYPVHLEYGTSKMRPRPWLRPSFEQSLGAVMAILGRRWS